MSTAAAAHPDGSWYHQGACAAMDPAAMDPDPLQDGGAVLAARTLCWGCPVRWRGLAAAMVEEDASPASHRAGVRGYLLPLERSALDKRLRAGGHDVAAATSDTVVATAMVDRALVVRSRLRSDRRR